MQHDGDRFIPKHKNLVGFEISQGDTEWAKFLYSSMFTVRERGRMLQFSTASAKKTDCEEAHLQPPCQQLSHESSMRADANIEG